LCANIAALLALIELKILNIKSRLIQKIAELNNKSKLICRGEFEMSIKVKQIELPNRVNLQYAEQGEIRMKWPAQAIRIRNWRLLKIPSS
jgi:hypothetical protein